MSRVVIERVLGWRFRTRELRPLPGETRRWLVVLNGKPHAIKRTVHTFVECIGYRGVATSTTEAVFVWIGNAPNEAAS